MGKRFPISVNTTSQKALWVHELGVTCLDSICDHFWENVWGKGEVQSVVSLFLLSYCYNQLYHVFPSEFLSKLTTDPIIDRKCNVDYATTDFFLRIRFETHARLKKIRIAETCISFFTDDDTKRTPTIFHQFRAKPIYLQNDIRPKNVQFNRK